MQSYPKVIFCYTSCSCCMLLPNLALSCCSYSQISWIKKYSAAALGFCGAREGVGTIGRVSSRSFD